MVRSVKLLSSENMVSATMLSCTGGRKKNMKIIATDPMANAMGIPEKRKTKVATP